jgi:DNA-binding beta-propeller fold protein YncE
MKAMCIEIALLALLVISKASASTCVSPSKISHVAVPGHPFAAMATTDNCWLFVSLSTDKRNGSLAVLRNENGSFALDHTVALNSHAYGEALSHDGQVLAIAGGDDTSLLDVSKLEHNVDGALIGTLRSGSGAGAVYVAISPDNRLAFVSDEDSMRISIFDLSAAIRGKDSAIGRIPTSPFPLGLAFSPDGHWLYATSQRGTANMKSVCKPELPNGEMHPQGLLLKVDVAKAAIDPAHALVNGIPAGCNPVRVAMAPDGNQVWVSARGDDALLKFQIGTGTEAVGQSVVGRFPIGPSPVGVAVRQDGKQVWVALSNRFGKSETGQLAGLSGLENDSHMQKLSTPAPGFAREVGFLPDGRTLIATLFDAEQVEFVPTPD